MAHPMFEPKLRGLSLIGRVSALEHPAERFDTKQLLDAHVQYTTEHFKAAARQQMSEREQMRLTVIAAVEKYGDATVQHWLRTHQQEAERAEQQHTQGRY